MCKEYIDKNYGQIFIIWDKIFGTFKEEMKEVPPVYGITRPVRTWNPIKINFQHMALMIKDAWRTSNWKDKFRIWFMPTGWRPGDVAEKYPVYKIDDVYQFEKYDPGHSKALLAWSWIQVILLLLFVSYLFGNLALVGKPDIFIYGAFLFLFVYAFTELMDKNSNALVWAFFNSAAGISIVLSTGDWFKLSTFMPHTPLILIGYLVLSFFVSTWFTIQHRSSTSKLQLG